MKTHHNQSRYYSNGGYCKSMMKKSKSVHKLMVDFPNPDIIINSNSSSSSSWKRSVVKPPSLSSLSQLWTDDFNLNHMVSIGNKNNNDNKANSLSTKTDEETVCSGVEYDSSSGNSHQEDDWMINGCSLTKDENDDLTHNNVNGSININSSSSNDTYEYGGINHHKRSRHIIPVSPRRLVAIKKCAGENQVPVEQVLQFSTAPSGINTSTTTGITNTSNSNNITATITNISLVTTNNLSSKSLDIIDTMPSCTTATEDVTSNVNIDENDANINQI